MLDREFLETLSIDELEGIRERRQESLDFNNMMLEKNIRDVARCKHNVELDKLYGNEDSIEGHKEIQRAYQELVEDGKDRILYLESYIMRLNDVLATKENEVEEEIVINTHKKLMEYLMKKSAYEMLKNNGFKGDEDNYIRSLLYATEETNIYLEDEVLSQEGYFKMLINEMNKAW